MDLLPPSEKYQVQLEIFEGPLDLLLHLIRQQEIDVYDIPIAQITDQYLRYLQLMEDLSINTAGDFLMMAATLIQIKSRMLLPSVPCLEEAPLIEDPREELVARLLEYERFKNAALLLHEKETIELSIWPRGQTEFEGQEKDLVAVNVFDLTQSFYKMVERYREKIVMKIEDDPVTLEGKLKEIRRLVRMQGQFFFSLFFRPRVSRLNLVVTLCALLELVRLQEIRLFQKGSFQDIQIVGWA